MTGSPPEQPCGRRSRPCANVAPLKSWSRFRWGRPIPAGSFKARPTRSSARPHPNIFTPLASITRISRRPATKKCAICSRGPRKTALHLKSEGWFTRVRRWLTFWIVKISEEQIKAALRTVKYPGFSRDIVSFGLIKSVEVNNGDLKVQLALATNDPNIPATIKREAESVLGNLQGVRSARVL